MVLSYRYRLLSDIHALVSVGWNTCINGCIIMCGFVKDIKSTVFSS